MTPGETSYQPPCFEVCLIVDVCIVGLEIATLPASILASSKDRKEFKLHTVYSGISEHIKPLQLVR